MLTATEENRLLYLGERFKLLEQQQQQQQQLFNQQQQLHYGSYQDNANHENNEDYSTSSVFFKKMPKLFHGAAHLAKRWAVWDFLKTYKYSDISLNLFNSEKCPFWLLHVFVPTRLNEFFSQYVVNLFLPSFDLACVRYFTPHLRYYTVQKRKRERDKF